MAPNGRLSHRRVSQHNLNENHNGNSKGDADNQHQGHPKSSNYNGLPLPIEAYIPPYLRDFVRPHHGDFCYAHVFHPSLITQLMVEGFLPIATERLLLPKLHLHRSVIPLQKKIINSSRATDGINSSESLTADNSPSAYLHISKSTRKKSKRFAISANCAFLEVIRGCQEQHGSHSWLYPPLVKAFVAMHQASLRDENTAILMPHPLSSSLTSSTDTNTTMDHDNSYRCQVRMYSIEVWNVETGALAGGELGYTVGTIYTSLTGFSRQDSAGSVQLAALGKWLEACGFELWDLGMEMDYKKTLGSVLCPRHEFVTKVHSVRAQPQNNSVRIPSHQRYQAKSMIDGDLVPVVALQQSSSADANTNSPPPSVEESPPCRKKSRS